MMFKIPIILILLFALSSIVTAQKLKCEWLFIYYMPYDNNLSKESQIILDEINNGLNTDNIIVSIQSDLSDTTGMKRYLIQNDTTLTSSVSTEYSGESKTYNEYLLWVTEKVEFEKCVLIFLDHGGGLNEICLDEYPRNEYLKTDSLRLIITEFKTRTNCEIELIFLQVCAKALLEPLYDFRDCSDYTLCSQNTLGAPNYYYANFFQYLGTNTELSGEEMALKITEFERPDMYYSYTCVNNLKLKSFIKSFNAFINILDEQDSVYIHIDSVKTIYYYGETHWDIESFIQNINPTEIKLSRARQKLLKCLNGLISFHMVNPTNTKMENYCGISFLAPKTQYYNSKFVPMEIFSDLNTHKIANRININGEYIFLEEIIFR